MNVNKKKARALVVVGAGASVEFGISATAGFGELIDQKIQSNAYCQRSGGTVAYVDIKDKLISYYQNDDEAHFERIYHVMHELSVLSPPTPDAVAKFRPVMYPFLGRAVSYQPEALRVACQTMLDFIYKEVSSVCKTPKCSLDSLAAFFENLEQQYIPRVYTTNYDDFLGQATDNRYFTGFSRLHGGHLDFDPASYWSNWNKPGLFHVHGSIHMGFPHEEGDEIGDIVWYTDRDEALKHASFSGSGVNRMDGTGLARSAIITGLDKLGRLQQSPYASYYSGLSRDAMEADVIFILGSGLADLHLNTWLEAVRRAKSRLPLVFVSYWGGSTEEFYSTIHFEQDNERDIALFHDLRIDLLNVPESQLKALDGWTIDANRSAAVWADGFQSFLANPSALQQAMRAIGA